MPSAVNARAFNRWPATGSISRALTVLNQTRASGAEPVASIFDVSVRDCMFDMAGRGAEVLYVNNVVTNLAQPIANVGFDNVVVANQVGTALSVSSSGADIENVRWTGGGSTGTAYPGSCIDLRSINGALLGDLTIAAGTGGSGSTEAVISLGAPNAQLAQNVTASDVSIAGVAADRSGIAFRKATNCGFVRGGMTGASSAIAATFDANSAGCFVEAANLSAIGTEPKMSIAAASFRLAGNYGSTQRSPVGFGAPVEIPMAAGTTTLAVTSSYVRALITAATTLSSITGGKDGDLLVLSTSTGTNVLTVTDGGTLKLSGNCPLASPNDTLTLIKRGGDWLEVARSINGP